MDAQSAILRRRSTRGFEDTPLKEEEISALIDAALAAPSCMNTQHCHFAFVTDRALIEEMDEVMRQAFTVKFGEKSEKRHFYNAPLFVAITYDPAEFNRYTLLECGIAAENLAISATGLGLGSVIIATPYDGFISDRGPYFRERMGIPPQHEYAIGIVIGHSTVTGEAPAIREGRISRA